MKTYLALISFGILSLQNFSKAAEEMIKLPQSLRSADVKISQAYTPFGNALQFNKFGDDGSSCVLDASGVLTWIDNAGTVRVLPNSDLAVPLYVTATECLVWNNRFVDYTTYDNRPNAELKLYRAGVGSTVLTEVALPAFAAKEILGTPPVTNTTSPLTFVTATRKDNGSETKIDDQTYNNSDDCELRVYRLTVGAGVQFLKNYNLEVDAVPDFKTNSSGPNVSAIGYGSDGSVALDIADLYLKSSPPVNGAPYYDQVLWLDDQGRSVDVFSITDLKNYRLVDKTTTPPAIKILSTTKTRLVYEVEQAGVSSLFYDLRRNSNTGALAGPATPRTLPSAMTGNVAGYTQTKEAGIDFSNYARVGDTKYFYTVGLLTGVGPLDQTSVISTYQITATDPILVNRAAPGITISSSALVGTLNPADGSALIKDEDGASLIWLHTGTGYDAVTSSATTGYSALPNSSQAKALFVTNEQAVIWENADAAKNANGSIPDVIVQHYGRNTTTGALTPTGIYLDGKTLLNTPRLTPLSDYWLLTTAQKPQADTSTLHTYLLRTAKNLDTDGDGLTDAYENSDSNTDPYNADSDGDGLSDGDEVYPFEVVYDKLTWAQAKAVAKERGGHLAVITSTAVKDALARKIVSGNIYGLWLGASNMDANGAIANVKTFTWVTGGPISYTNYKVGEPNGIGAQALAIQTDFTWTDESATNAKGYVIEYATTDPNKKDSDGDGYSDGLERARVTNPNDINSVPIDTLTLVDGGVATGGTFSNTSGSLADGTFATGTFATLTAVPALGYVLQAWTGDLSGSALTQTLLMNGNKKVGATFVRDLADDDSDGLTNYDELVTYGTNPKKADSDGDGFSDDYEVKNGTKPNDVASVPTYTLTLANGGVVIGGSFSKISGSLAHGTTATLKAVPDTGYVLLAWTDDLLGSDPTLTQTLLMDGNKTVNATFVRDTREPPTNIPNFLRQTDVTISQAYTPFGNRLEFNRFGDDGSSCVLDANGVLTWIDSLGTVHVLPNTDQAIPLFVTNTECLVWSNRFVDYDTYATRPAAVLTLYRSTPGTATVTSSVVPGEYFGKEVLATAPVTTTTGTLTFVTSNRVDNGDETLLSPDFVNLNDTVDLRVYRLTVNGDIQFLQTLPIFVKPVPDFINNVDSPLVTTLGSGSDGSLVVLNQEAFDYDLQNKKYIYDARGYWIDSEGRSELLDGVVSKVLYTSNTRLIFEDENGLVYERRRNFITGELVKSASKTLTLLGKSLNLSNYTKPGNNQFFYTLDTDLTTVRTYLVIDAGVVLIRVSTLPSKISYATQAGSVNPADGSAILYGENGEGTFWLNSGKDVVRLGASLSKPLYVTDTQAVIWQNARAPVDGDGKIPPAEVYSYTRDLVTKATTSTRIYLDGTTLLNTPILTPDFPYWVLSTAEKTDAATALLRTYRLASAETSDKDNDGILDQYETKTGVFVSMTDTGTDPNDPDTDGDGRRDGEEVYPFAVISGNFTWQQAAEDAVARGGRLATLTTTAERDGLKQMLRGRLNYSAWLGATDSVAEGVFKWVTGEAWVNAASQWAPGKPDNVQNADGLMLRTTYQWADAPLSQALTYVIEYPSSDPNNADSDGDGFSDGDEIKMRTDPGKADTDGDGLSDSGKEFVGSAITGPDGNTINYSNPLVSVDYEGLVMDPVTGIAFKQKLTLTKTGPFTSTLLGLGGDYSYKGTFTSTGAFREDNPDNLQEMGGWSIVDMNLVYQNVSNTYYIQGYFENEAGDQISFELRPARKDPNYAGKKLNFEASVIGVPAGPTGSAVATGSINKTTSVASFKVYFPDGSRGSYSGAIVDGRDKGGNLLMPYCFGDLASSPVLVGVSVLRTMASQSNVDGTVRLYSGTSDSANLYPDGFDQLRKLKGSFYVQPATNQLPLPSLAGVNNTLYRWTDENGTGLTGVGTWTASKLSLSSGPAQGGSATVDRASGLVTVSRIPGIGSEMRQGKAVVLQTSKSVKGFYSSPDSMGSLVLAPNAGKIPAAVPGVISKSSYTATAPAATYAVTVKATGPWAVSIPTDATWVTATPLSGSGNGSVTITVAPNTTNSPRTAVISIAGVEHTITQAFQPPSISRSSYSGSKAAVSYQVKVVALGDWSVSIPANASSWVTATPLSGNGNGTVTITLARNGTTAKTHKNRSTTITIAGRSHTIKQTWK